MISLDKYMVICYVFFVGDVSEGCIGGFSKESGGSAEVITDKEFAE